MPPTIGHHGDTFERIIFPGKRRSMSRRDLHVALEPLLRAWIRAACTWTTTPPLGDYRFVIFSLEVAPETEVYVQFWSEPFEPIVWEVSSGRWNPPADEWLAGERARRIEAHGFAIGGKAENYHRIVEIANAAEIAAVAKTVVRIFYDGFDYRGLRPITARLVHEGRAETNDTYDSFTPQEVATMFITQRFAVQWLATEGATQPALRCRKRGIWTTVAFEEQVDEANLYRRIFVSTEVKVSPRAPGPLNAVVGVSEDGEQVVTATDVFRFGGGVTLGWLVEQIDEWDQSLADLRREMRQCKPTATREQSRSVH